MINCFQIRLISSQPKLFWFNLSESVSNRKFFKFSSTHIYNVPKLKQTIAARYYVFKSISPDLYCKKFSTCNKYHTSDNNNPNKSKKIVKTEVDFNEFESYRLNGTALIIDVRNPHELQEKGKIPNTLNIPLPNIPMFFHGQVSDEEFEEEFGVPKPKPDDAIIFFCQLGIRSEMARNLLTIAAPATHVYKNVASYPGSFNEWNQFSTSKENPS